MKHKAVTQRILAWMLALALLFTGILPANTASLTVNAASTTKSSNEITTAEEFPTKIPAGETYTLTADIKLADGQQITDLGGTLDGQGHVITLSGKALAENVSGTIQNLGVAGSVDVTSGYRGSIADNLTGTIQNSYSQAKINDNWNTVGGLAGTIKGGTVRNCYYAAELKMMNGGIAAYAASDARSQISNSYFQSGTMIETVAMAASNADVSDCASKSADELKTADTVALLNTGIVDTGYIFAVSEDGGFPLLVKGAAEISWTPLENALKQAEGYEEENYTEESWKTLSDAVAAGNALKAGEEVTQEQITAAAKAITDAIAALKNRPTTKPVALPENARNLVCVAQLLRAQVGVCLRTFALFAAEDQDDFLKQVFQGVPVNKLKDFSGEKMSDGRLQDLLEKFDPKVKDVYKVTSGFVHFSIDILPSMGVPGEGYEVEFNFGAEPNERNNAPLVECGKAFCHYVDLHLQMLHKVIASDEWYADRFRIDSDGLADEASKSEKV